VGKRTLRLVGVRPRPLGQVERAGQAP
jgi:hypothetical protein